MLKMSVCNTCYKTRQMSGTPTTQEHCKDHVLRACDTPPDNCPYLLEHYMYSKREIQYDWIKTTIKDSFKKMLWTFPKFFFILAAVLLVGIGVTLLLMQIPLILNGIENGMHRLIQVLFGGGIWRGFKLLIIFSAIISAFIAIREFVLHMKRGIDTFKEM
jgi:hypothetical protein